MRVTGSTRAVPVRVDAPGRSGLPDRGSTALAESHRFRPGTIPLHRIVRPRKLADHPRRVLPETAGAHIAGHKRIRVPDHGQIITLAAVSCSRHGDRHAAECRCSHVVRRRLRQDRRRSSRTADHGTRWRPVSHCRTVRGETPRYVAQALRLKVQLRRTQGNPWGRRTRGARDRVCAISFLVSLILHNIHYAKLEMIVILVLAACAARKFKDLKDNARILE